jgi:4-hydroxy-tetrahydrodipicolinate synthase
MPQQEKAIRGSITAMITPFKGDAVDHQALEAFTHWQIEQGTHGLVPCGTTGESPTLAEAEHIAVIKTVVKAAKGRVPVIAGTGSNNTAHAIHLTQAAEKAGADAALVVAPYYNKPTQEGLYLHFRAIAEATGLPIILYNVPARCSVDIGVDTMARLSKIPNIVGVKDATANLARASLQRAACKPGFTLISGEDATALGFNAHGGVGAISVTSNVAPKLCAQFQEATLRGDYATALKIQDILMPLHDVLFAETSPGPAKYAVSLLGRCSEFARLPLAPVSETTKAKIRAVMLAAGLLEQ